MIILNNNKITYNSINDIPDDEQELIKNAFMATNNSYAPYSNFHVGAALLLGNGTIIKGSNQENAAYPSGLCAERVAIFHVMNSYSDQKIKKIAITARKKDSTDYIPASPCGGCRQVMLEQEQKQQEKIEVIFQSNGNWMKVFTIMELLPFSFDKNSLK
ncbi:MAG: cytidine deaminase [Cyclobacteriaceae bacterium]|nr:cytidine deaminase [Cyclobacteriaceae bacterium]